MPPDAADTAATETAPKPTHGGARPGAGAPRGPRPETVARLARLREIAAVDEHVSGLSNLDIVQIQVWRLWSQGEFKAATDLALRLLPYHHARKPTVTVTRAEPAGADADAPADAPDPEPVPALPRRPTPRPFEARLPRCYDRRIEVSLR